MGNSVLSIAKSSLLLFSDSHDCCNAFIASVTIRYLSCVMEAKNRSLRPLWSGLGKWGCPSKRQNICLMLNCSLTNTPDGILRGLHHPINWHSMFSHATRERQKEAERFICQGQWQTLPWPDPEATLSTIQLGGLSGLLEGNLGLAPWGISTKETTQPAAMQTPTERRSYPGHLVLDDEPFVEVGVLPCWKRTNVG